MLKASRILNLLIALCAKQIGTNPQVVEEMLKNKLK